ncbi:hypothetical protein RI129_005887 [Pyrocoelia pectoralis]|uniref:Cilia- and flagella-associated protein 58 central coiled coil domain-containing protein n=1 Tax=Pyrocoelia pectoralis TaxID=417401 RepID=A0AAN7ZJB0_9COLE
MDLNDFDDFAEDEEQVEEQLDPNNPDHAFIILEREFTKTIADIEQNSQAAQYAEEFNKLFEALYTNNEIRKQLIERCAELEQQLAEGTEKLMLATKVAESDAEVITNLKGKIEYSWRMTDAAHEREQQAQETIDNLRNQINALTAELDLKNKMSSEDDEGGQQNKNQESFEREKEKLLGEVAQLQVKLANAIGYQEELERKNSQADLKLIDLSSQLQDLANDLDKTKKQRDKLEVDSAELNTELVRCNGEIRSLQTSVQKGENMINRLQRQMDDLRSLKEKLLSDLENLTEKHENLHDIHKELKNTHEDTKKHLAKTLTENKLKDDQANKMRSEINKFSTIREQYDKKIVKLDNDKRSAWEERDLLRQIQISAQKEIQDYKRQSDADKRVIISMVKEKELLNKNILKHQGLIKEHIKLFQIQQQSKRKLEMEISEHVREIGKQRKQVSYLEKERERLVDEGLELRQKIEDTMEEIKLKKAHINDLKRNLVEHENKLRTQQNLFEGVRAERNNLQKALQESTAECGELKNKLKVSSHQSEQLKEDIAMKEQELIREENILRKITKDKENLRVELDNSLSTIKELKNEILEMKTEEKRLHKVISESDRKIKELTKDLETLMNERDILGSQLVRRNDELALLYEKIRILQSTLQRGEAHYERRLEDIRLLKVEVKRLRQEKLLLTKSITNMTDLRQEVFHLERDLTRESLKCRALEEELQNPLNIHRWRKLEGSDPDVLELLKKVQLLQKRLLHQTSEGVERERQLKEAEKLYTNLKQIMSKQPGPTIQEDLNKTRKALTLRGNKLKCLVSELNMTELQAIEYKDDLDKVREELKEVKKKYLIEKKAHQKDIDTLKTLENKHNQMPNIVPIKFTGGGFKMSVTNNEQF